MNESYGGNIPARTWARFMRAALANVAKHDFPGYAAGASYPAADTASAAPASAHGPHPQPRPRRNTPSVGQTRPSRPYPRGNPRPDGRADSGGSPRSDDEPAGSGPA